MITLGHLQKGKLSVFILYLTVWGVEPVVTHQTSWLEDTGVYGVRFNARQIRLSCVCLHLISDLCGYITTVLRCCAKVSVCCHNSLIGDRGHASLGIIFGGERKSSQASCCLGPS